MPLHCEREPTNGKTAICQPTKRGRNVIHLDTSSNGQLLQTHTYHLKEMIAFYIAGIAISKNRALAPPKLQLNVLGRQCAIQ